MVIFHLLLTEKSADTKQRLVDNTTQLYIFSERIFRLAQISQPHVCNGMLLLNLISMAKKIIFRFLAPFTTLHCETQTPNSEFPCSLVFFENPCSLKSTKYVQYHKNIVSVGILCSCHHFFMIIV